jgi:hypothetical protein
MKYYIFNPSWWPLFEVDKCGFLLNQTLNCYLYWQEHTIWNISLLSRTFYFSKNIAPKMGEGKNNEQVATGRAYT